MKNRFFTQHKTTKTGSLLLTLIFVATLFLAVSSTLWAADPAVEVVRGGGNSDFAKDAPIATVRLDHSKLTKENVKPSYVAADNFSGKFELNDNGEIWANDCDLNADYTKIGSITLAFPDAALLPDGTKKTLEIVFDQLTVIRKTGAGTYEDDICVAGIADGAVAFSPLTKAQSHMALRAEVTYRVKDAGDDDTFLFDARHINVARGGDSQFALIVQASDHYNYSESMEPTSGVVAGSHLYLPTDSALRVETGKSSPTLGHRFVGKSEPNTAKYTFGFAAAATAQAGFKSRVWSSAGTNPVPLQIFFLSGGLSHELTASSGDGGKIELWSDGKVDSAAPKLAGGTLATPRTYDVPNGKEVTLKMTPQSGYEIGKLYVNGEETEATAVLNSAGRITHYTYTFDADQSGEQEIRVTWHSLPPTAASVWWKYDDTKKTLHISGEAKDDYMHFPESVQATVEEGDLPPWGIYLADVETAVIEGSPAPVSTACWFFGMEKLLEIQNLKALDTSQVTDMSQMFIGCESLAAPDLSGFVTVKVTDMSRMFQSCLSFSALDLSGFDVSAVKDMSGMFAFSEIETIYVAPDADWTAAGDEKDAMFTSCRNLAGGNDTSFLREFDAYGLDRAGSGKYYARVDGLNGEKGYFTAVTYGLDVTSSDLDLGNAVRGYDAKAYGKYLAVENTGNQGVTFAIDPFTPQYFDIKPGLDPDDSLKPTGNILAADTIKGFWLYPKADLAAGDYSETIRIPWLGGMSASGQEEFIVNFKVEKNPLTLGLSLDSWTYGEPANAPVLSGNAGDGAVKYEYKPESAPESEYKETVPTAVGKYTLRATVAETDDYLGNAATTNFEIYPAITIAKGVPNGSIDLKPADAKAGEEVTITVNPGDGYDGEVKVTDDGGNEVPLKQNDDGAFTFTMPTTNVTVTPTFVKCPSAAFTDVDRKAWYHDYVDYVVAKGLMKGVTATTFEPETATSRAMLVMTLYRLAGEQEISGKSPFKDVKDDSWYAKAVIWAYENKIVEGYGNGKFGPNDPVTREQLVTIFYRYSQFKGYDVKARGDLTKFKDADKISSYAKEALSWAVAVGLVEGMDDGTVAPKDNSTRAQIAAILTRFCETMQ